MISLTKPKNFKPDLKGVGCFVLFGNEFLSLQTAKKDIDTGLWGVPGGRIEDGETPLQACKRELKEEAGLKIEEQNINLFRVLYRQNPKLTYTYYLFYARLATKPQVKISDEHRAYAWVTKEECLKLPLRPDEDECIKLLFLEKPWIHKISRN